MSGLSCLWIQVVGKAVQALRRVAARRREARVINTQVVWHANPEGQCESVTTGKPGCSGQYLRQWLHGARPGRTNCQTKGTAAIREATLLCTHRGMVTLILYLNSLHVYLRCIPK